jgi:hypothetical protein
MPRLSYSKRAAIRQAVEMQKLLFSGAQLLNQDLLGTADKDERARVATALGGLCRNWTALQDSVRVLKGDPMPGSLKPEHPKPKRRRQWFGPLPDPIDYPPPSATSAPEKRPSPISTHMPGPPSPAVVPADTPTAAPAQPATVTPPVVTVRCPVCRGSREVRISDVGKGGAYASCTACGGTGRRPAPRA